MKRTRILACLLALAGATSALAAALPHRTALDDYVDAHDSSYAWRVVSTSTADDGSRSVIVDLVSQRWLTDADVDRTEWQHWLALSIPATVSSETGMLFIGGGRNGREPPTEASARVAGIAKATQTVVAELGTVPNQPLVVHGDGNPRSEDDLIGYAWDQYLESGDPRWAPRNAMVKSAVRAMDTVTAVMASEVGGQAVVDRFVVAGGSKRGWTTWLTGAVDPRVVAIIPIVIDVVNVDPSMRHHFAAYGFWAPSVGNYVDHGIMARMDHPRLAELYRLVDPYFYRHRLTMPKLVLNATGDQFFLPDSSRFYWDDLRGENYLRYVPNADHGLDGSDAVETMVAFHTLMAAGIKPPQYSWSTASDGTLRVLAQTQPREVRLWQAHNPEARDFRVETIGRAYTSTPLLPAADGLYVVEPPEPASGWTAWFVELTFDVAAATPLKLTTSVTVTPDTLPFAAKPSGLPTSVTLVCRAPSDAAASEIGEAVAILDEPGIATDGLSASAIDDRLFVNWTPAGDLTAGARAIAGVLAEQGCMQPTYQLESGPGATLPPLEAPRPDQ
ncbi:MAG: PhoPQ-activated protein PqaA family protein [Gammaproteobacteria bacterium]|nr:PhoPQ-activated protein PqaA family protein [Gammaproteobacteria bacterium]